MGVSKLEKIGFSFVVLFLLSVFTGFVSSANGWKMTTAYATVGLLVAVGGGAATALVAIWRAK